MKTVGFFGLKGGVGRTTLAANVAYAMAERGVRVLLVDLDPQSALSVALLPGERLAEVWQGRNASTVFDAFRPLRDGDGGPMVPGIETLDDNLGLLVGDFRMVEIEEYVAGGWPSNLRQGNALRHWTTAVPRLMQAAGEAFAADLVMVDMAPAASATNRAALRGLDGMVTPVAADLFLELALGQLGRTVAGWRAEWSAREPVAAAAGIAPRAMKAAGYIVNHVRYYSGAPVTAQSQRLRALPALYRRSMGLGDADRDGTPELAHDPLCLGIVRQTSMLAGLQEGAGKPVSRLTTADGAVGALQRSVMDLRRDFDVLGKRIAAAVGLEAVGS